MKAFERLNVFWASCVAVLLFSATVQSATYIIVADFVEERENLPNATLEGTLYYLYDDSNFTYSRLRFEYTLPGDIHVSNLYHYEHDAKHSMYETECTSFLVTEVADPWFYDEKYYTISTTLRAEGDYTWYDRTSFMPPTDGRHGPQVKHILLGKEDKPTNQISTIIFADGRTIQFYNVTANPEGFDKNNAKFDIDPTVTCPTAACSVYADVVFVLDNSESINSTAWKQQSQFVMEMMNAFPFGTSALEAAALQLNGPIEYDDAKNSAVCPNRLIDGCWHCIGDWNLTDSSFPGAGTAELIAGGQDDYGSISTVSDSRRALDYTLSSFRPEKTEQVGNTCQGFGLELAMRTFDRSPRNQYRTVPNRVVIVMTDGYDMCPNRTADAATKLKEEYGALIIEIGLNIVPACKNYTRQFLERVSSNVGGVPSYYPLDDFDSIHELTEKVFKVIFDYYKSECDPLCKSFCGAGHCFCPKCKESDSTCYDIKCSVGRDGKSSHGCVLKDIECEGGEVDDICTMYQCHGNETGEKRCSIVENECTELKNKYTGICHKVKCHYTVEGGCYVELDHAYCQNTFGDGKCVLFECTPVNETIPEEYKESGCRPKANYTAQCLQEYEGKEACFDSYCDVLTGECVTYDKCKMDHLDDKCYSYECSNESGSYECKKTEKGRPAKSMCTDYQCSPDGWVPVTYRTPATCRDDYWDEHIKDPSALAELWCSAFACDEEKGCEIAAHFSNQCSNCSGEKINSCLEEGARSSDVEHCLMKGCKDASGETCYDFQTKNCTKEMAAIVAELNSKDSGNLLCYTPACGVGNCTYVGQVIPKDMPRTKCMEPKCTRQSDGSWKWVYGQTQEKITCESDACFDRQCDDELGCVNVTNLCAAMNNKCYNYTCDISDGIPKCVNISLLSNSTCILEGCYTEYVEAVGEMMYFKSVTVKNLTVVCPDKNDDYCHEPRCRYDPYSGNSWCYYVDTKQPKQCEEDKCLTCDCIPETGEFDIHEKCVSGDNCTIDQCDIDGVCSYERIQCDNYINMTGYDCFFAECRADRDKVEGFRCYRKLFPNAYIDICGQCIKPSSGSSSEDEDELAATTECTGAPVKPLLKEGLAAATIGLIVIFTVLAGIAVAASGAYTTKVLVSRAKEAETSSVVTNPMFRESEEVCHNSLFEEDKEE